METLIVLNYRVFDLLTYTMNLLVDLISYGLAFNLKCEFKLIGYREWKNLKANI